MTHDSGQTRRWSNRPLHLETDTRRTVDMWMLLLAILLTAAPFGVWLLGQIEYMELSYHSEDLRRTHERLIEDHRRLERERAALESLDSIENWALKQRGLVVPDAGQIVVVRPASEPPSDWMARDVSR